jgi:predicted nucleic acid-binding protein
LKEKYAVDTSVLIEVAFGTTLGDQAVNLMKKNDSYLTHVTIIEMYYILCRKIDPDFAGKKINDLISSGYVTLLEIDPFEVGLMKCKRNLSLADCHVLALANKIKGTAVFKKETELEDEIAKAPFTVSIKFIEELI